MNIVAVLAFIPMLPGRSDLTPLMSSTHPAITTVAPQAIAAIPARSAATRSNERR
jgi:hypothetical protein